MNRSEVAMVLGKAAIYDRRTIAEPDVLAWHEVLRGVEYQVALDAVAWHYARETRWLMPADVLTYARRNVRPARKAIDGGPPSWARTKDQQQYVAHHAQELRDVLRRRTKVSENSPGASVDSTGQ